MKHMSFLSKILLYLILMFGCGIPIAFALTEVEPNHPCSPSIYDYENDVSSYPFTVDGVLDSSASADVDFLKFHGTPGAQVQIDLLGVDTGNGTLSDPYLGFFDSFCNFHAADDDSGGAFNSRLVVTIPPDGVFIMAATTCCDDTFSGGGNGSYQMTVSSIEYIGSISGQVLDQETGEQIPYYFVALQRCDGEGGGCFDVNYQYFGFGQFYFSSDFYGNPLVPGTYRILAAAFGYQNGQTEPFAVAAGEDKDVGDVLLSLPAHVGSISGRVTDALTGSGLPGTAAPFAHVTLQNCQYGQYDCYTVNATNADSEGRFSFNRDISGYILPPGPYQVILGAEEYVEVQEGPFDVADGENRDLGNIALKPFPVRISEIRPCGSLPPEGGKCSYSFRVTSRLNSKLDGVGWSIVSGEQIGSLTNRTEFQAGSTGFALSPGDSKVIGFAFNVPSNTTDGASICVSGDVGQTKSQPYFNTVGHKELFCIVKGYTGAFSIVSPQKLKKLKK